MKKILKNDRWHSDDWIKNVQTFLKPTVEKITREYYRRENLRPKRKISCRNYDKSEKGRASRRRTWALRSRRVRHFLIPEDEKEMIRKFYEECPKGYVVDHIIPIAHYGQHRLFNLQWLLYSLNARKGKRIMPPLSEYPHCRIDLLEII